MLERALKWISAVIMTILVIGCVLSHLAAREEPSRDPTPITGVLAGKKSNTIPRLDLIGSVHDMNEKEDVRKITVQYQDETGSFRTYAKLKIQGASSRVYEKKNYTVKFFEDKGYTTRRDIDFGWGEQSQYCLKANWVDKTHARNIVSAWLAAEMQAKYGVLTQAPNYGLVDGYPVEVYANGEFLGLYTLNIPRDAWMLGMDKENKNHLAFFSTNCNPSAVLKAPPNYFDWGVEVGEKTAENMQTFTRLADFVMESSDAEFREHQPEYFDLDVALNYIVLCEFGLMEDNSGKNMILATYDRKVWYPILYDMDASWGAVWSGKELHYYQLASITSNSGLLKRVKEIFPEELVQRYFELREDILTKEHVMDLFERFADRIPAAVWEKEQKRWRDIPGFDYTQIEDFLDQRIPWLDENMLELLNNG